MNWLKHLPTILGIVAAILAAIAGGNWQALAQHGGELIQYLLSVGLLGAGAIAAGAVGVGVYRRNLRVALETDPPAVDPTASATIVRINHPGIAISAVMAAEAASADPEGAKLIGSVAQHFCCRPGTVQA